MNAQKSFFEREYIGSFLPPLRRIYVIAGNLRQFQNMVNQIELSGCRGQAECKAPGSATLGEFEFNYVAHPEDLFGCKGIEVCFCGSWFERSDVDELKEHIRTMKACGTAIHFRPDKIC